MKRSDDKNVIQSAEGAVCLTDKVRVHRSAADQEICEENPTNSPRRP